LRRLRRVVLRWDPLGPPPPRAGPPLRLAPPAGAPLPGAPGRGDEKPPAPGREGPPGRDGPVLGRAVIWRPVAGPRPVPPAGIGRRAPGGGGIGRPLGLSGRPGGGGIGRPVDDSGGRVEPSAPRALGRMVVGPSGDGLREGVGLGGATRDRTTWVRAGSTAGAAGALGAGSACVVRTAASTGASVAATGAGVGAASGGALAGEIAVADFTALVALAALSAFGASEGTSRRSPSASARRRMRSAWASSIEAEGLEAPIPSFPASASNSLLVIPSSLESSCTRIFFGAKTFPYFASPHIRRAQFPILSQLRPFPDREVAHDGHLRLAHTRVKCVRNLGCAQIAPAAIRTRPHPTSVTSPDVPGARGVTSEAKHLRVGTTATTDDARTNRGYASSSVTVSTTTTSATSPSASVITVSETTASASPFSSTTTATVSSTT